MINKKVGIITFHASENFGSVLQAFAMQHILEKFGYDSDIIDFILESDMQQYKVFRVGTYKRRPAAFLIDVMYYRRNKQRKINFELFSTNFLKISSKRYYAGKSNLLEVNKDYDIFICGSDQIWNLNCLGRMVPEFFLSFADDLKKKIAFAPSMPKEVSEKYFEELRSYIGRLDYVSVREKSTVAYLKNIVKVENNVICAMDPTLLLDKEEYIEKFSLKRNEEQYICIYVLDYGNFNRLLIKKAQELARIKKLKIKYICVRWIKELKDAQYCLGIGPIEFLETIYNATYVITDSFHAVVFSIHFQIPFCIYPRSGSESRVRDLLDILDLKDNVYSLDNIKWINSKSNKSTNVKLKDLARNSLEFLLESLK